MRKARLPGSAAHEVRTSCGTVGHKNHSR